MVPTFGVSTSSFSNSSSVSCSLSVMHSQTSIFFAKSHLSQSAKVSSPMSAKAWNSSDKSPPITPVSAVTIL